MKLFMSVTCSCITCHKIFSYRGIFTHFQRAHGTTEQQLKFNRGFYKSVDSTNKRKQELEYKKQQTILKHKRNCKNCNIEFSDRNKKFCSSSCSASFNNTRRIVIKKPKPPSIKQITKQIKQQQQLYKKIMIDSFKQPCGPFSVLLYKKCAHCNVLFVNNKVRKYCATCNMLYTDKRAIYRFRFNIYDYPELFDLALLDKIGWYAPRGKSGNWNPHGLSRDHKVSVSDAIKNNYNPYYITHVMNCQLITQTDNRQKRHRSSLTYEELVILVDNYDNLMEK